MIEEVFSAGSRITIEWLFGEVYYVGLRAATIETLLGDTFSVSRYYK
jgi:hypothetical protein